MSNYNVNLTDITDTRQVNVNVTTGDKGWSPELVMVRRESDGALVALREWIGGSGEKPTPPQYVAEDGFTDDIEEAVNFQGDKGDKGDKPNHEWIGYSLRFELPNGDWGTATDLRGEKGEQGFTPYVGDNGNWWIDDQDLGFSPDAYIAINSTSLPTPETSNNFSLVTEGTYTRSGQSNVVVPDGKLGVLSWDGSVWSLASAVDLPTQPVTGVVKEGEIEAVNGDAVYNIVKPLYTKQILTLSADLFEQGTFTVNNGSGRKSGTASNRIRTKQPLYFDNLYSLNIIVPEGYDVRIIGIKGGGIDALTDFTPTMGYIKFNGEVNVIIKKSNDGNLSPSDITSDFVVEVVQCIINNKESIEMLDKLEQGALDGTGNNSANPELEDIRVRTIWLYGIERPAKIKWNPDDNIRVGLRVFDMQGNFVSSVNLNDTGELNVTSGMMYRATFARLTGSESDIISPEDVLGKVWVEYQQAVEPPLADTSISVNGLVIDGSMLEPGGIDTDGSDTDSVNYSRTTFIEIPNGITQVSYTLMGRSTGTAFIYFYDESKELISSHIAFTITPSIGQLLSGVLDLPKEAKYVRAKDYTAGDAHDFRLELIALKDVAWSNKEVRESTLGINIPIKSWVIGGISGSTGDDNTTNTNYRLNMTLLPEGATEIEYELLFVTSGSNIIFFYDVDGVFIDSAVANEEITPTISRVLSGVVKIPKSARYVKARTLNETHENYQPYNYKFRIKGALSTGIDEAYLDSVVALSKAYTKTKDGVTRTGIPRFNLVHFTDVHHPEESSLANMDELIAFTNHPVIKNDISGVIFTGDATVGTAGRDKALTIADLNVHVAKQQELNIPTWNVLGNHDDNISMVSTENPTNSYTNLINKQEQYELLVEPLAAQWENIVPVENKMYSHVDFDDFKIRIINLDAYDWPYANNGSGGIKYKGEGHYYSQDQLEWLYDVLADTPSDYGVIVGHHGALATGMYLGKYLQGNELIPDIINAWKNGGTLSHSFSYPADTDLNTSVEFDFTTRGVGEFICYLAGHTHSVAFKSNPKYSDQKIIVAGCMLMRTSGSYQTSYDTSAGSPLMVRANSRELRNSFNFLSVDRLNKRIAVVTIGAYRDVDGEITSNVNFVDY